MTWRSHPSISTPPCAALYRQFRNARIYQGAAARLKDRASMSSRLSPWNGKAADAATGRSALPSNLPRFSRWRFRSALLGAVARRRADHGRRTGLGRGLSPAKASFCSRIVRRRLPDRAGNSRAARQVFRRTPSPAGYSAAIGSSSTRNSSAYRRLFEDLVVYGYVKRFGEYGNGCVSPGRSPTPIRWPPSSARSNDHPAASRSMSTGGWERATGLQDYRRHRRERLAGSTWRSDFSAVLQQGGGPASLLQTLRERTDQLKAELGVAR